MELIKSGDIVVIRHYSGEYPLKSMVVDVKDGIIVVKLTKGFLDMNFFEGDPLVIAFEKNSEIFVIGCTIINISPKDETVSFKIDKIDTNNERRKSERYPVSLYADVKIKGQSESFLVTLKEISYDGMLIKSKAEWKEKTKIELDLYMDDAIVPLKGIVIRSTAHDNFYEYGIEILYEDAYSVSCMKEYLEKLRKEQLQVVESIRQG